MTSPLLAAANFLHLLATITWIGSMFIMRLIVEPALHGLERSGHVAPAVVQDVLRAVERRAATFMYGAVAVFVVSGLAMMSQNANYAGVLTFSNLWTRVILVKHVVVAALIVGTAYVQGGLGQRQVGEVQLDPRQQERRKDMADVNLLLGIVILGLTAIATAIPPAD